MSDFLIPIDYSNLKDLIPPGEDIIYSTLCAAEASDMGKNKTYKWETHLLVTENGIAFSYPKLINYTKKELKNNPNLQNNHYIPWGNTIGIARVKKRGRIALPDIKGEIRFSPWLYLMRFTDVESKEQYNERIRKFLDKFKPIQEANWAKLEEELFNILVDNPELLNRKAFYEIEEHSRFNYVLFYLTKSFRSKEIKRASKAK